MAIVTAGGWNAATPLVASQVYTVSITPPAGGLMLVEWSANNVTWTAFVGSPFARVFVGTVPQNALFVRAQAVGGSGDVTVTRVITVGTFPQTSYGDFSALDALAASSSLVPGQVYNGWAGQTAVAMSPTVYALLVTHEKIPSNVSAGDFGRVYSVGPVFYGGNPVDAESAFVIGKEQVVVGDLFNTTSPQSIERSTVVLGDHEGVIGFPYCVGIGFGTALAKNQAYIGDGYPIPRSFVAALGGNSNIPLAGLVDKTARVTFTATQTTTNATPAHLYADLPTLTKPTFVGYGPALFVFNAIYTAQRFISSVPQAAVAVLRRRLIIARGASGWVVSSFDDDLNSFDYIDPSLAAISSSVAVTITSAGVLSQLVTGIAGITLQWKAVLDGFAVGDIQ